MKSANIPLLILALLVAGMFVWAEAPQRDQPPQRPHDQKLSEMDGPGRRGDLGPPPMTEEETREAIEVLRKIDPEKAANLEQHLSENPRRVARVLRDSFPKIGRFLMMKKHDPKGFDLWVEDIRLNREAMDTAERFRRAQAQGGEVLAAAEEVALKQTVAEHFNVRQQIREHQLFKLEERINEMREQLIERASDRDELIEQRLDALIGEAVGDRW
jgi:flagellar biosynthesis/type III secretory pathway M-ring protein FliF/YscJ